MPAFYSHRRISHDSVERLYPALWESFLAVGFSREGTSGPNLHLALGTVAHTEQMKTNTRAPIIRCIVKRPFPIPLPT